MSIYLWTDGAGWKSHELSETDELAKRGISIGDNAIIWDNASIGYNAIIEAGTEPKIINIIGSRHQVNYWGRRPYSHWLSESDHRRMAHRLRRSCGRRGLRR